MITSQELQILWSNFWIWKKHQYLNPVSLIADKTSTALFNIAGMQQLIPYLSGQEHPLGTKLYNIQPCVRTNDLNEVGDNSHLTSFFMMWNRSLWDYFKQEAVWRSWEFLTEVLKLDPRKLAVTVYKGDDTVAPDDQTADYRKQKWVNSDKISYLNADDNRRSPGAVGPCGPCTEIYYRVGETEFPTQSDNVKSNENNRLEIWNNVFMEYYRDEKWSLSKLKKQNVDTGMGFERMLKVLQKVESPYETDLFLPLLQILEKESNQKYEENKELMRVIVDHLRTSSFLIAEWLLPSNEGRWYVLRRIMRRIYFQLVELYEEKALFQDSMITIRKIIEEVIRININQMSTLEGKSDIIYDAFVKELQQFAKTLDQGKKILRKYIKELWIKKILPWDKVFMLHDTFWFPLELTEEVAKKQWIIIDKDWFDQSFQKAQIRSRNNTNEIIDNKTDRSQYIADIPSTIFIGYNQLSSESNLLKSIEFNDYKVFIFDKTPFYATKWGQIHDRGTLEEWGLFYEVFDVQDYSGVYLHFVKRKLS